MQIEYRNFELYEKGKCAEIGSTFRRDMQNQLIESNSGASRNYRECGIVGMCILITLVALIFDI